MTAEILKKAWGSPSREIGLLTHPCCQGMISKTGQQMSRCVSLLTNGSIKQSVSPKERRRRLVNDTEFVAEIKQVSELPSYGYRLVLGGLRRGREVQLLSLINVMRVYRVMRGHNLLLERRTRNLACNAGMKVETSNERGCSDGFAATMVRS